MLQTEPKSVVLKKDLAQKVLKPGDLVLDMFAGMLSLAKARLLVDKCRRFRGCENDSS